MTACWWGSFAAGLSRRPGRGFKVPRWFWGQKSTVVPELAVGNRIQVGGSSFQRLWGTAWRLGVLVCLVTGSASCGVCFLDDTRGGTLFQLGGGCRGQVRV